MALFLVFIIWVNRYGDRAVRVMESRMKLTRGLKLESSNKLDDAIRNYEDVVSADERALRPRVLLVRAYMKVGSFAEALSHAERAVETAPPRRQLQALLLLSGVCREMGLWNRARVASERAIQASSRCAEAHYGMAKAAEAMRMYARMVEALDKVARLGARGSSAEYEAARRRRREEIAEYKTSIREHGGSPEMHYKLGVQYKETGLWQDAVEAFKEAAGSGGNYADATFWLGVDAEAKSDLDSAIVQYRRVVETCPNHLNALINLKRCLLLKQADEQPHDAPDATRK